MREDFLLKQTPQTHLGPHYCQSEVEFYVKYIEHQNNLNNHTKPRENTKIV